MTLKLPFIGKVRLPSLDKSRKEHAVAISKNRVYCMVFLPDVTRLSLKMKKAYSLFKQKFLETYNYKHLSALLIDEPPLRGLFMFLPKEQVSSFENVIANLEISSLFLKVNMSTPEDVLSFFKGNKTLRFTCPFGWMSIFSSINDSLELEPGGTPFGEFSFKRNRGGDIHITIKCLSKGGIKYFKDVKKFLDGQGENVLLIDEKKVMRLLKG